MRYIPELIDRRRSAYIRLSEVVSCLVPVVPEDKVPEYYEIPFDNDSPIWMAGAGNNFYYVITAGDTWSIDQFFELLRYFTDMPYHESLFYSQPTYKELIDVRSRLIEALAERERRVRAQ